MPVAKIRVFRFDPSVDREPRYETYSLPYERRARIITLIERLQREYCDLSFVEACRSRMCGLCGARVNGKPVLLCWEEAEPVMTVDPLPNFEVIRDLVVDRRSYEARKAALLRLLGYDESHPLPETVREEDFARVKLEGMVLNKIQADQCIECLLCHSVCPAVKIFPRFVGPALATRIAKAVFDPRMEGRIDYGRLFPMLYGCTECFGCVEVCPVGIKPVVLIKKALRQAVKAMAVDERGVRVAHVMRVLKGSFRG